MLDIAPNNQCPFYAVPQRKLIIMSLFTLGLYEIYWHYRNWQAIKRREDSQIMPFWRGVFSVIWFYYLVERVRDFASSTRTDNKLNPTLLALAYFVMTLTYKMPGPFWLISLLSFIPILPVNDACRRINQHHACNNGEDAYSKWDWAGIVIGGIILVLAVIGSFLPETP